MTDPARRLFATLGRLPHGLARTDLPAIMPEGGDRAASTLAQMALVRRAPDRLRMLSPVRELAVEQPLAEPEAAALIEHFGALADALPYAGISSYDADAALRARVEIPNIKAILPRTANADTATALGRRWIRIGDARQMLGSVTACLAAFAHARTCVVTATAADPTSTTRQHDLSVSWNTLGSVREAQGDLAGALDAYNQSQTIRAKLAAADPGNAGWQRDLSVSWERLASVHEAQSDQAAALEAWRRALAISKRLAASFPGSVDMQTTQVVHLAGAARHLDRADPAARAEAADLLDQAVNVLRPLAAAGRLDTRRQGWIGWIEGERSALGSLDPN